MIIIAGRNSPLSIAQMQEVALELQKYNSSAVFQFIYLKTRGDYDKITSLRTLEKTDFFTREIDELVLSKKCDAAVHSAKDLPEPIPKGLCIAALTKGIDPRDALVFKNRLPENALVATSSDRREESVRQILPNARFVDIRGTIHERLSKLDQGEVDGVVVAEAAMLRLKLVFKPRQYLPGPVALHQGRLAIIVREDNFAMREFFKIIHDEEPLRC